MDYSLFNVVFVLSLASMALSCAPHCTQGLIKQAYEGTKVTAVQEPASGSDLNCGFGAGEQCCWRDEKAPRDTLDFHLITNPGSLFTCAPAGTPSPDGPFMALFSQDPFKALTGGNASFVSCPLSCTAPSNNATVTLRAWKSPSPRILVCRQEIGALGDGPLQECQPFTSISGRNQSFTFSSSPLYQIVIFTSGFVSQLDFVGFDDIRVETSPCTTTTTTTTTASTTTTTPEPTTPEPTTTTTITTTTEEITTPAYEDPPICSKVVCDFSVDLCGWTADDAEAGQFDTFASREVVGNSDTGVNAVALYEESASEPRVSESPFAAVTLKPGEKAMLVADELDLGSDLAIEFDTYEACEMNRLKVCVDSVNNCRDVTEYGVSYSDRNWITQQVTIPAGTQKMLLIADNSGGRYHCSVGLRRFTVSDPTTQQSACLLV